MDPVAGSGRLRVTDGDELRGSIRFHLGDRHHTPLYRVPSASRGGERVDTGETVRHHGK
jgi:hypothetical protein